MITERMKKKYLFFVRDTSLVFLEEVSIRNRIIMIYYHVVIGKYLTI